VKKIEAIVRPEKLAVIRKALEEIGIPGVTITEVRGHGAQRGIVQQWRGSTYTVDLISKVKLEMVIADELVERALEVIHEYGRTGEIGDGKVFVSEILDVMRVRTGERGQVAV
jgi:nitrogen regulatory protein P-II 1